LMNERVHKLAPYCIVFIIGLLGGYCLSPTKTVTQEVSVTKEVPKIVTMAETKTEVKYIEKENAAEADVKITNKNPTIEVDGKKYEFEKLPEEKTKFENGQLQVAQQYKFKVDTSMLNKTSAWGIDIGYSNHGLKIGAERNFNKHVSMYVEGTPKPETGRDYYYGTGIRISF